MKRDGNETQCPFLKEGPRTRCATPEERLYIPSTFLLKEYCENKGNMTCPFFSKGCSGAGSARHPADDRK